MNTVRCFIAIEISADIRPKLSYFRETLAAMVPVRAVRWVQPANIHLTLKFLGDVNIADVELVGDRLVDIAVNYEPFELRLGKLGCFPNPRKPRVIWVGVEAAGGPLLELQHVVEAELASMGSLTGSRRYHPHLTLGRVKDLRQVVLACYPWGEEHVTGEQQVAEICLVQSDLRPSGAVHTVRKRARLGGHIAGDRPVEKA